MPSLTVHGALRAVISLPMLWAPLMITVVTFAAPAAAQETPAENAPLQEVVVTGIRRGIEDAIKVKEDSGSIVEAISAEDIGKLPDTSIAESISRLPGLTSQRAEGRASAISLRGTDPGFTTTLLNGREQVSTGDNRSIEFDQYPSELLSAVVIYKTPPEPSSCARCARSSTAGVRWLSTCAASAIPTAVWARIRPTRAIA